MHCWQPVCCTAEQAVCQHAKHSWEGSPPGIGEGLGEGLGVGFGVGVTGVGAGGGLGGRGEDPPTPKQEIMSEYGIFWQCPPEAKCDSLGFPNLGHKSAKYNDVL